MFKNATSRVAAVLLALRVLVRYPVKAAGVGADGMSVTEQAVFQVGDWRFTPAQNELARGADRRFLEFRAALVLEHLCLREGEVVSKEDLVAAVWQGRSLSDHTVAVVISALRKALDDDVRKPRYIETVAKRGYRLIPRTAASPAVEDSRPGIEGNVRAPLGVIAAAAIAALVALAAFQWLPARMIITVNNIRNETGDAGYDRVAAAANAFSAEILAKADGSILVRDFWDEDSWAQTRRIFREFGPKARVYHLSGSIIIDGGRPYLALSLADARDWSTVWTKTAAVEEGTLAKMLVEVLGDVPDDLGLASGDALAKH